ncbi:MAG: hypothetical protein NVS2B14_05700 [Chamaesiphon sp.]
MVQKTQGISYSSSSITQPAWGWIHIFILVQFTLQLLLLFPQFGVVRLPIRIASFAFSLFLLVWLHKDGPKHPATTPALAVLVILILSLFFHPSLNTFTAGVAQCAMYAAILGPIFWVQRLKITPNDFQWLIFLLWGFHTLSSIFGVLQVYFPGQFQPYLAEVIQNSAYGGDNLLITLANGQQTYRPMGLTDTPGGAATAGFYALLLGVGIALQQRNKILRVACLSSAIVGLFCIYLSQVRSVLIFTIICLICLITVLARKGEFGRVTALIVGITALFMTTFTWAVAIGGESTFARLSTLVADNPDLVYQENRGQFLQNTINVLLPQYPLGAGLGRWGMMNGYFGNNYNQFTQDIYVEIQWTGWLLDGGVPLIIAYVAAITIACITAWQIAMSRKLGDFALWGGLVFAYNIGSFAITFNYPLFNSQTGMEFWLLNTSLFMAAYYEWMHPSKQAREARR